MNEFCWLIEAPGQNYLCAHSRMFAWTKDVNRALRFCSAAHADHVAMAVRELNPALFAFATLLGDAKAVEHKWMEPANDARSTLTALEKNDDQTRPL